MPTFTLPDGKLLSFPSPVTGRQVAESIAMAEQGLASDKTNPFLWRYLGQSQFSLAEGTTNQAPAQALYAAAAESFRAVLQGGGIISRTRADPPHS